MSKIHRIIQLAKDISHQIVQSPDHWKQYLNTAARVYKYPFRDQLFIYAQKPEATACASMKLWNDKMGCWINRGAKGYCALPLEQP